MENSKLRKEYEANLGKLFTNILSLEMLLRLYLFYKEPNIFINEFKLDSFKEGDIVPNNYFTNSCTLRPLIEKYNIYCTDNFRELSIDPDLANVRNALAHGRVLSQEPSLCNIRLFNFELKNKNQTLTYNKIMDKEWFKKNITLFLNAIRNVHKRIENDFPEVVGQIEYQND
jgi:hypothetical protein